jgi:hypothetical protein
MEADGPIHVPFSFVIQLAQTHLADRRLSLGNELTCAGLQRNRLLAPAAGKPSPGRNFGSHDEVFYSWLLAPREVERVNRPLPKDQRQTIKPVLSRRGKGRKPWPPLPQARRLLIAP